MKRLFAHPYFWWITLLVYSAYHLITLNFTPTPWFDEEIMLSLSKSFMDSGELNLELAPYFPYSQNYHLYGPLYFWCTSTLMTWFGIGVFQYRLTGLLFGIAAVLVFRQIVRHRFSVEKSNLFALLFMLDPIFQNNLHEGRMDSMAIFFVGASFWPLLHFEKHSKNKWILLSAILALLALLTTPRSAFFLFFIAIYLFYSTPWRMALIWSLTLIVGYLPWVFWAFGSVPQFISYYTDFNALFHSFSLLENPWIPMLSIPMMVIAFLQLALSWKSKTFADLKDKGIVFFCLTAIVCFHLLVKGGNYVVFVIPLYAMLILSLVQENKRLSYLAPILLIISHLGISAAKLINLDFGTPKKHQELVDFVGQYIPPGSRTVGPEKFYYAALTHELEYQSSTFWWLSPTEKRVDFHKSQFDLEYLIAPWGAPNLYPDVMSLDTVAVLRQKSAGFRPSIPGLAFNPKDFSCVILKRKKIYENFMEAEYDHTFYLSESGSDTNIGDLENPLRSLEEVRERLVAFRKPDSSEMLAIHVVLREGTYRPTKPLLLNEEMPHLNITFEAFPQEAVRISGAKELSFEPGLERLSIPFEKVETDFTQQWTSCWKNDMIWLPEIFVENQRMKNSIWPEKGWGRIGKRLDSATYLIEGVDGKIPALANDSFAVFHGFPQWDWADYHFPLKYVSNQAIQFEQSSRCLPNQKLRLQNVRSAWDSPGEYYFNYPQQTIDLLLPPHFQGKLEISTLDTLIQLQNCSNITFRGIHFSQGRGSGIIGDSVSQIEVEHCTFQGFQGNGIQLTNANQVRINHCEFHDLGEAGITLKNGVGQVENNEIEIEGNKIHDIGINILAYRPAIHAVGSGMDIHHNEIFDCPHAGIIFKGSEIHIHHNELYNTCHSTSDVGVIYCFNESFLSFNNQIEFNYIHDINYLRDHGSMGVYLDGFTSGTRVKENVIVNCPNAIILNGGFFNEITSNWIIDCIPALKINAPGFSYSHHFFDEDHAFVSGPKARKESHPEFYAKYPELKKMETFNDARIPQENLFENNHLIRSSWKYSLKTLLQESREYDALNSQFGPNISLDDSIPEGQIDLTSTQFLPLSHLNGYLFEDYTWIEQSDTIHLLENKGLKR
ncbi:right-handed parallel beta-helix repeat-containing protein [bacterium SCSIO 12741]|nr:right-handed parallel beta-helix repeat-containing protein [bacterium SCSIO 12741]